MRRQKSTIASKVKVLTASAVAAALATGTINVYAATGIERLAVEIDDKLQYLSVQELVKSETFRDAVRDAFLTGKSVLTSEYADGDTYGYWQEISAGVTAAQFATGGNPAAPSTEVLPYDLD